MEKIIFGVLLAVLLGCESDNLSSSNKIIKQVKPTVALTHSEKLWVERHYVDFEKFKQGRPCGKVRFNCLPESVDKSWQSIPTADGIEDFDLTKQRIAKYKKIIKKWHKDYENYYKTHKLGGKKPKLITDLDRDFFEKINKRKFLEEMEQDLGKEFPGFWREVPKKVRYRWIRRAMNKAKKFGYDPEKNQPMIELCARIGLDFDLDPKWEYITKFVKGNRFNVAAAYNYIDFTIFKKNYKRNGVKFTDWSLARALRSLPYPERPVPRLND